MPAPLKSALKRNGRGCVTPITEKTHSSFGRYAWCFLKLPALLRYFSVALLLVAAAQALQQNHSLALSSEPDRAAFRRWFTFLAEAQYFIPPKNRPAEIVDCSSLVRYAYREALRDHNSAWAAQAQLPLIPAIPSVRQYNYPKTPVGPRLFRTANDHYAEFADAETLYRYNVFFVTRDLLSAAPGDLLFFRHLQARMPFHTMIVLGHSQISGNTNPNIYVVYNTGPDGTDQGEIKRLTVQELLHFPERQWQPIDQNPAFLGVYRWNILKPTS